MHFVTLLLTATLNYSSQTLIKNFRIVNVKGQENQLLQVNIHCYLKVVGLIVKYNYTLNMKPKNPHLTTTGSNKSNIGCKKKIHLADLMKKAITSSADLLFPTKFQLNEIKNIYKHSLATKYSFQMVIPSKV